MHHSKPWKHVVLDNFLIPEDFTYLRSLGTGHDSDKTGLTILDNHIDKNGKVETSCLDADRLVEMNSRYHSILVSYLRGLAAAKESLYTHSEFHIVATNNGYEFPIHDDTPNKILSCVVYLSPEENLGTYLYSANDANCLEKVIEWKPNRALIFSRRSQVTWHSYASLPNTRRLALVYNLMTTSIDGANRAESLSSLDIFFFKAKSKIKRLLRHSHP